MKTKKALSLILVPVMIVGLMGVPAFADEPEVTAEYLAKHTNADTFYICYDDASYDNVGVASVVQGTTEDTEQGVL